MDVISDLREDLVRECLLRVPYNSHKNLKAVCRSWEAMLSDPKFYADRKVSGASDQLICLLQRKLDPDVYGITVYDPVKGTSESLLVNDDPHCPGIPISFNCVCLNRKLVLIGVLHPSNRSETKNIYIYDFVSARWSRGADIPNFRYLFAYAASSSTGRIYFAGGHDGHGNPLATAEAYDVEEDKWGILPPMTQERVGCQGVFSEGMFMVLSGLSRDPAQNRLDRSTDVFDSRAGTWTRMENMWSLSGPFSSCVPFFCSGQLYALHHTRLMRYDSEKNVWTAVASLPPHFPYFRCVTQWHDWLFVSTKRISYLVYLSTGQSITIESGEEFVYNVTTLEI